MKKLKLFSLLMLLFVGVTSIWGADIVVTLENIGHDLGSTANTTMDSVAITAKNTTTSYKINYYQCKKQGESMLMTKSVSPFISNHTAMPGDIKSVKVTINTGAAKATTYDCAFSASECTSAISGVGAVNITGGNSNTYNNPSVTGKRYFCITLGNANNGQVLSLEITCASPTEPLITTEPDSIGFGVKNIFNNDAAKSGSATIKVTGANLDYNISAALDKKDNGTVFSLSTASLDKASSAADLIVSYSVTATGSYDDTLRLTSTGAPTVKIPITLKVVSENRIVDSLTVARFGVGGSYANFADKGCLTDAEYSGYCKKNNNSIQITNNNSSGIVSTFSDGIARSVKIKWTSTTADRGIKIYGKNTKYTTSDLSNASNMGTEIGSISTGTETPLEIEDDYEYIGIIAYGGVVYIDSIAITWAPVADKPAVTITAPAAGGTLAVAKFANGAEMSTGDEVAEGKLLRVTAEANNTTHMGGTVKVIKTGVLPEVDVTSTVMAHDTLTMPDYDVTVSATFDPRPRVTISPKSLNFGNKVEQGDAEDEKNFTISGNDLTSGQLTISLDESIKDAYTISPASIDVNGTLAETTITVTPVTTNFGTFNGNIKVNGGGLATDTATVAVSMTIIAKNAVTITQPSNGVITVKNADNEDVASDARIVVGKRMKVTVAPNDSTTHRETLKIYKTDDEETTISVDENDSITMPSYPITIESTEVALFGVALEVKEDGAAASHGTSATMNGGTADVYKAAGETVALTATRVTGYQFDKWTTSSTDIVIAAADSTKTSITATINGAGTITANFRAVPELLVSETALDLEYAKLDSALDAKTFTISGESLEEGELTLTLDNSIKDAFIVSPNQVAVNGKLNTTIITVTPVTSVAGEFSGNLTISGGGLAVAKTVALTSVIEQTYTVTWNVNGTPSTQTDIASTALVAPSAGTISGKTVIGWTDAAIATKTDTKPTIVSLPTMPAKDTTLYALYATESSKDSVLTFSYTFTSSDFGTSSYPSVNDEEITATCTKDNQRTAKVAFSTVNVMNQSNYIQGKASTGKIFNAAPWGKGIKSVDITNGGNGGNFSKGIGSSVKPTSVGTGAYFQVYVISGYCTASSFTVAFDSTVNVTTYNAYVTRGYAVTIADGIEHGTITLKNGTASVESGSLVAYGTTLTVEAEPESDQYILSSLLANTTDIKDAMSFTMGNEAVTIVAEFIDKSTVGIDNTEVVIRWYKERGASALLFCSLPSSLFLF